jgi:hypothetical protein
LYVKRLEMLEVMLLAYLGTLIYVPDYPYICS